MGVTNRDGVSRDVGVSGTGVSGASAAGTFMPIPLLQMPLLKDLSVTHGSGTPTFTRASVATYFDKDDGLVKSAAVDTARFETEGLLLEGASTNLLTHSEDFGNVAWTKTVGVTWQVDDTAAPDGLNTADRIMPSTGGSFVEVYQNASVTIGKKYTQTFFAKSNGLQYLQIIAPGGTFGTFYVNYDIVNGTITDSTLGTSVGLEFKIVPVANGFFRVCITAEALSTTANGRFAINFIKTATTGRGVDEGAFNGTDGIFAWGGQMEEQQFCTSYILTVASAVTRSADSLDLPVANIPASSLAYSVSASITIHGDDATSQTYFNVAGETSRTFRVTQAGGAPRVLVGTTELIDGTAVADDAQVKFVVTSDGTNAELYQDKVSQGTVAFTAATGVKTAIEVGRAASAEHLHGYVKDLRIYDVALTAAQVNTL